MVRLVSSVLVLVLGVVRLSQTAAARSHASYEGEQQRLTSQCTYAETARVQLAARALGLCLDVHMDDVKEALLLQRQHGNLLGGIDLEQITACWQAQEDETSTLSPVCADELARFDEKASSQDGSPASKIASKLRDHPDELCACVETIDISEISCKGWGVMPAIQNVTQSCDLLRSHGFQNKLPHSPSEPTTSKDSPVYQQQKERQQQQQQQQQQSQQQQPPQPQQPQQREPPQQPQQPKQPEQPQQQQQQQPPLPAPAAPKPQPPHLLDPYFGRGEDILGGSREPYHPDERTQRIMYCFETAVHLCPQVQSPLIFQNCAERAVRQGKLGGECLVVLQEVSIDSLALQELQGLVGRHDLPLDADQLQCVKEVSAECEDAKNSGQLRVCVNKGVRKQKLRSACLSYLYQ